MGSFKRLALTALTIAAFTLTPVLGTSAIAQSTPTAAETPTYDRTNWPDELNCGLFGGDDAEAALRDNGPLADYLAEYLGIPVKYQTGTSYNAVIESMRSNHTNCGTVGSFSYILAVEEAGAEALAISVTADEANPVFDPAARPSYFSVISVKKGSGITSLTDLAGKTLSFVDPASTSGFLIPSADLVGAGLDPEADLETVFSGSHPTSALALWNDKVDAAASTEATLVNLAAEGQIDFCGFGDGLIGSDRTVEQIQAVYDACPDGSIVAIHYSAPIPNSPFSVKSDLPESLKTAIKDALLAIKDNPELLAQLGRWYTD
ncbi:MAG: phosphate/phosphite/phosphonate ABC transporter substrate-binding protein, partial [Thermomicrobiales bacterium]